MRIQNHNPVRGQATKAPPKQNLDSKKNMQPSTTTKLGLTLVGVLALTVTSAHADPFGSGVNTLLKPPPPFLGPPVAIYPTGVGVAGVPEPTCAVLIIGSGLMFLLKRRRASAL